MRKILHFLYIPWTGLGIIEYKGDSWFDYRIDLFKKFVLPSLTNQTTKDFVLWCSFRKEERYKPQIDRLEKYLDEARIKHIFTFDGIMMWDDRGLRHNQDLKERMEKSLDFVKKQSEIADWVYKTDLGSDDMLSAEALEEIQKVEPKERGATYYLNGYVLDMERMRLADWNRTTSCSKYTVIYPYDTFFNAEKHLEYVKGLVSHEFIPQVFNAERLPDGRYMCGVHQGNISTTWENSLRGRQYNDIEKKEILKRFGL